MSTCTGSYAETYARQAVALHRRTQAIKLLGGEREHSDEEAEQTSRFTGSFKELASRRFVSLQRKARLRRFLSGDEDEDLKV